VGVSHVIGRRSVSRRTSRSRYHVAPIGLFVVAGVLLVGCGPSTDRTAEPAAVTETPTSPVPTTVAPTTTTTIPPTTTTTAPPVPAPAAPTTPVPGTPLAAGQSGPEITKLQQRLSEMGYWQPGVDGTYSSATKHAVTAFQKANGLPRNGRADGATLAAMAFAARPTALKPMAGRSLEVDLSRQILMVVNGGQVEAILDISSGKSSTPTPRGDYHIQRQIDGMRISDLGQLWRPKYFTGGYAMHGSPSVPTTAASHGCVRLTNAEIDWLWASDVAPVGTPVSVYAA
jgi:peptidoglycan hydrolase-like protein with peptidoglycan-binding domain